MSEPIERIYKFRAFNQNTLSMLCEDELFFADPANFNDPLDCNPSISMDMAAPEIEELAIKLLKFFGDEKKAWDKISNLRDMSTEYGDYEVDEDAREYYATLLSSEIKALLDKIIKVRGVCSFAQCWNSPLMWSHYADEHRGICIAIGRL
ncbi:MAG: hypothetical protein COB36_09455 [Alphaproteobacteria bacterium]|nr:MAG: hypothetical protein COB36_09455 [Alphaproteobacteria bacterium]